MKSKVITALITAVNLHIFCAGLFSSAIFIHIN